MLSFGSRNGGFDFACDLKTKIVDAVGWQRSAVYVDADALEGKAGTKTTDFDDEDGITRHSHLNPSVCTVLYIAPLCRGVRGRLRRLLLALCSS